MKTAELEGRLHYVVPMVMIRTGVWCGSGGPTFYPADVLRRSVPLWNGKPIVVYHPTMHGLPYAGRAEVFNKQKVGTIFNTTFKGDKLKAEAWLDRERLNTVDSRVLASLNKGQPMNVSTGVGVDLGERNADGAVVAARLTPDHLAILPNQRGACSLDDGAGLLLNVERVEAALITPEMVF